MQRPSVEQASFLVVVALVTVAFLWLLLPYYSAVLWAVILAILFNPLQRWLVRILNGRRNLAAALSVFACICIVVIPGAMILASLAQEASGLYQRISTREFNPVEILSRIEGVLPDAVRTLLPPITIGSMGQLVERLASLLGQASQVVASRAVSIGQGTAQLFVGLGVMLYLLFFLFRDGPSLAATIRRTSPLSAHHTNSILGNFTDVVLATVKGNVIIAFLQGAIGGIAFWLLGINGALLWGVLMAMLSLVPAIGAFLVWGPAALYLILSGDYLRGTILLVVGVFVISMIDNILRPPLVGKGTRLPDYVVLISTLGGLSLFGIDGLVVGPLIAALFVAVWSLRVQDQKRSDQNAAQPGTDRAD